MKHPRFTAWLCSAAALVLLAGCALERRPLLPGKGDWPCILKVSLFQTVLQYLCYYLALRHTSGVAASILVGANSFFAILIAALCFRMERLTAAELAALAVSAAMLLTKDKVFHYRKA